MHYKGIGMIGLTTHSIYDKIAFCASNFQQNRLFRTLDQPTRLYARIYRIVLVTWKYLREYSRLFFLYPENMHMNIQEYSKIFLKPQDMHVNIL